MSIRAVAFDLDDTLVVAQRDRSTLLRRAAERADAPRIGREDYLQAHGTDVATETRRPIFESVLAERVDDGLGEDIDVQAVADRLAAEYRDAVRSALAPVPGAESLVRSLRRDYAVGLLTDGPTRAQRGKLETLGWTDLFDATVVTGELPAGKPDPRAFEALVDALDADPETIAYVGDHPEYDVAGAATAGLRPVQVLGPGTEPHPDAVATVEREALATGLPDVLADL